MVNFIRFFAVSSLALLLTTACPGPKAAPAADASNAAPETATPEQSPAAPPADAPASAAKKHVANIKYEAMVVHQDGQPDIEPYLFNDAMLREKLKATTKTQGDFNLSNRLVLSGGQGKPQAMDDWQAKIESYAGCDLPAQGVACDPVATWVKAQLSRAIVLRLLVDDSELARWSLRDVFPLSHVNAPNADANIASLTLAGVVDGFHINGRHPLLATLFPDASLEVTVAPGDLTGDGEFDARGRVHTPDSLLGLLLAQGEDVSFADGRTGLAFGRGDHPFVSNFGFEIEGVLVGGLRSFDLSDGVLDVVEYKDGEDGVSHTRPSHKSCSVAHEACTAAVHLGETTMSRSALYHWRNAVLDGKVDRRSMSVIFHNDAGEEAGRMSFDAKPTLVHVSGDPQVEQRSASSESRFVDELAFTYTIAAP